MKTSKTQAAPVVRLTCHDAPVDVGLQIPQLHGTSQWVLFRASAFRWSTDRDYVTAEGQWAGGPHSFSREISLSFDEIPAHVEALLREEEAK